MPDQTSSNSSVRQYRVWDRTTRAFHWINVGCILVLGVLGTMLLNGKRLGLSPDGVILVKTLHAYAGYVFATNLAWRLVWAFAGNRHARWRALLPGGRGFGAALREQIRALRTGRPALYVGRSPLGRIIVTSILVLLVVQAATGLVLAGTDLYFPPFGAYFAAWVTEGDPRQLALLLPGSSDHVSREAYDAMRAFRRPFKEIHEYLFFALLGIIVVHVGVNVIEDARYETGQISAMFSGVKSLRGRPADGDDE